MTFLVICRILAQAAFCISGLFALIMAGLGGLDVVAQFLGQPLAFKLEISEVMLASAIFLALPLVQLNKADITIDLFSSNLRGRAKKIQMVVAELCALLFLGTIGFLMWRLASGSFEIGETAVGYWQFPVWPFKFLCAIGVSISAMVALSNVIESLRREPTNDE